MYARRAGGTELTFDFAAGLIGDNLLIVDRETDSVWSQLHGRAVMGPMEGEPLRTVPALQTTWRFWRERHPETRVMVMEGEEGRPYLYRNRRPGTPPPQSRPSTHDTSVLGLGLALGEESMFFPLDELGRADAPVKATLGGARVTVHHAASELTAWAEDGQGRLLPGVMVYRESWREFNPETREFRASGG